MCQTGTAVGPSTAAEALALVRAGLAFLASVDAAGLTAAERADCLRGLAQAESAHLAATSRILQAFDAAEDYTADGQGGPRTWLGWQTRATRPAAGGAMAWMRRLSARPQVAAALAAGRLSVSYARRICDWLDTLPTDVQDAAEGILVQAAIGGADLADLAALWEEIRARTARPDTDGDDRQFGQRRLWLDTYYHGHGSLHGDLTPQAATALQTVLDSLNGKAGPEDMRSKSQRNHDALEEACRLLAASGCLPGRAGQPVQVQVHMTLSQLLGQPESDPALAAWIAAHGTPAPPGADCDAQIVPIVTGTIDPDVLAELSARHPGLAGLTAQDSGNPGSGNDAGRAGSGRSGRDSGPDDDAARRAGPGGDSSDGARSHSQDRASRDSGPHDSAGSSGNVGGDSCGAAGGPHTHRAADGEKTLARASRAAAALTIADAVRLLSGPAGIAARLRGQLTGPAGTPSLPLDVGTATDTIPVHIRRAVTRRDGHCRFPGCDTPPARCHVHHLRPRADGGETSLTNCCLVCPFHHLTAIHRWGWQLILNPDGTTTATSPDRTRVLHSHAPPSAA